jgi:hypothetical protein
MKFTALATALALVAATSPAVAAPRTTTSAAALSLTKSPAVRAATKTSDNASRLGGGVLENPYVSLAMAAVAVTGILLVAGAVANDDAADSN